MARLVTPSTVPRQTAYMRLAMEGGTSHPSLCGGRCARAVVTASAVRHAFRRTDARKRIRGESSAHITPSKVDSASEGSAPAGRARGRRRGTWTSEVRSPAQPRFLLDRHHHLPLRLLALGSRLSPRALPDLFAGRCDRCEYDVRDRHGCARAITVHASHPRLSVQFLAGHADRTPFASVRCQCASVRLP
jgi:hypothetical protein